MRVTTVLYLGRWVAGLTFIVGTLLIIGYLVSQDTQAGLLVYFFSVFAGIFNGLVMLLLLRSLLLTRHRKKALLYTLILVMLVCLSLLFTCFYII
ncbi:MAG: hypothetical protein HZA79_13280 [Sphingobacteriales bacterium]|nr:hypothetical protein [Sphingobacteriales bacterium]